jgi:hypothetical protein
VQTMNSILQTLRWRRHFRRVSALDASEISPSFTIPDGAEVLVVTHILELPLDLGLPENRKVVISDARTDIFQSWSPEEIARLLELPRPLTAGTFPAVRFNFRRRYLPERAELFAAFEAFSDWILPYAPKEARCTQELLRQGYRKGSWGWITAVGVTTFLPVSEWPTDRVEQARTAGIELDKAIAFLNEFLISLSLTRSEPVIHPIGRGDLPSLCPVILETVPMPSGIRNATAYPYQIHQIDRHRHGERDTSDELSLAEQSAFELFFSSHLKGEPFFPFYELMQSAIGSYNEGRFRLSVTSVGTAFEVLILTVIREASPLHGDSSIKTDGMLQCGLKNQLNDHVPRLASCKVDLADPVNAFGKWNLDGYVTRNNVVHKGILPTREQAKSALEEVNEVASIIRSGLLSHTHTNNLGQNFLWGLVPGS